MPRPKTECPVCKKQVALNVDGTFRQHGYYGISYGDYHGGCEASGYHLADAKKMTLEKGKKENA